MYVQFKAYGVHFEYNLYELSSKNVKKNDFLVPVAQSE